MKELSSGTAVRYCKPSTLDEQQVPTDSSFRLRKKMNEKYLSVYLLDFLKKTEEKEGLLDIKSFMGKNFKLKPSGAFALLDIKYSKEYILQLINEKISYKELNLPHCGVFHEYDDLVISELLSQCVKTSYIIKNLWNSNPALRRWALALN